MMTEAECGRCRGSFCRQRSRRAIGDRLGIGGGQQRHEMRVLEPRGDQNFAMEAGPIDAVDQLGRQHLDDHGAVQRDFGREEHMR